jgi:hypothetical protein
MLVIASIYVAKLCISLQTTRMYWQCTYLGFGLLEAPCKYILHGPLLAIYWPRLCPHSRERAVRSLACPEDAVYSLNDSSSCFTQRFFPPSGFSPMYSEYLIIIHSNGTHSYYTSHSYYVYIAFIRTFTSSFLRFFCSSWQAGCPRLFVSNTTVSCWRAAAISLSMAMGQILPITCSVGNIL